MVSGVASAPSSPTTMTAMTLMMTTMLRWSSGRSKPEAASTNSRSDEPARGPEPAKLNRVVEHDSGLIGVVAAGYIVYIFLLANTWRSLFEAAHPLNTPSRDSRTGDTWSKSTLLARNFRVESVMPTGTSNNRNGRVKAAFRPGSDTPYATGSKTTPFKTLIHKSKITNIKTTSPLSQHRVCIRFLGGGLGNNMFQYAAVVGLAQAKHMLPMVHTANIVFKTFNVTGEQFEHKASCAKYTRRREHVCCSFDNRTNSFTGAHDLQLRGYRQSWMYFHPFEDRVRKEFTFRKEVNDAAILILEREMKIQLGLNDSVADGDVRNHSRTNVNLVGIHVRRGDITYAKKFIKYGYLVPGAEYFHRAMNAFRSNYSNVIFIVCSNHQKWGREKLSRPDVVFISPNSAAVDMAILSLCDHTIMSVGSYGWWSGFLAGGTVIYYGNPVRDNSTLSRQFSKDMKDFYYPHWIRML